ncbi:MAG: hypothetical protein ACTHU0_37825 [Kofleriaceae bacterium]
MDDDTLRELELQHELQRFTTRFTDRITQATEVLERSPRAEVRDEALRKNLVYVSSATEIATGPSSEVGLLDMFVFLRLSRTVLEQHWLPELYGRDGADLAAVFEKSEQELAEIADRSLGADRREQLGRLVDAWLADNPGQVRVEGIRLADFSAAAGTAAAERAIQAQGLLSSVKTMSQAANQAMLLTERGMFLVHRLPFLWRLQARLGAREVVGDAIVQLSHGPEAPLTRVTQLARRGAGVAAVLGIGGLLFLRRSRARG